MALTRFPTCATAARTGRCRLRLRHQRIGARAAEQGVRRLPASIRARLGGGGEQAVHDLLVVSAGLVLPDGDEPAGFQGRHHPVDGGQGQAPHQGVTPRLQVGDGGVQQAFGEMLAGARRIAGVALANSQVGFVTVQRLGDVQLGTSKSAMALPNPAVQRLGLARRKHAVNWVELGGLSGKLYPAFCPAFQNRGRKHR